MILVSPYDPRKVLDLLEREVDRPPSPWRSLVTLNGHYFSGTAPVCGTVHEEGFELRSRSGPAFSLRANGTVKKVDGSVLAGRRRQHSRDPRARRSGASVGACVRLTAERARRTPPATGMASTGAAPPLRSIPEEAG